MAYGPVGASGRRGAASYLLLPAGPAALSLERAAPLLGNHRLEAMREAIARQMPTHADLTPLASTLARLAYALDEHGAPIDYGRRRALFTDTTVVFDESGYRRLCVQNGWGTGTDRRIGVLRWHLLALLTGEDHPTPDWAWPAFASQYTTGRMTAPRQLRTFLRDQARANLDRHGIAEPVTWEPPTEWADSPCWPGLEPAAVDPQAFATAVATAKDVHHAAAALGLTGEHVRLVCEIHDTGKAPGTANGRPVTPEREHVLQAARLRQLYLD